MKIDSYVEHLAADAAGSNPGVTVGTWREDDAGGDHLVFVDENVAALRLEDIWSDANPGDHGALAGLGDDDHSIYLNVTRHNVSNTHVAAFNNSLPITGDVAAKATLGAHVAATETHWLRPAQSHLVAENSTGQYATIAAALTAANAAASGSSPQEVVLYPGIYDENNLTVNDYVSLRAVVPWQASVASNSANPIFKLEGNNHVDGLNVNNQGAGNCFDLKTSGTGAVIFDQVSALSASGSAIDYNGSSQNLDIKNGSRIQSSAGTLISAKTANSTLTVRSSLFDYGGSAVIAALIDIDDNSATTPDIFDSCQFYADNLISGGAAIGAFFDWDANDLRIRNCYFQIAAPSTKDIRALYAQSGSIYSHANHFKWVSEAGTPYDYYTETGAQINTLATAYDFAKVGGTGTVATLNQGDFAGDNLTLTGKLSMNGDDAVLIDLDPSGTDPQEIISIVPSAAIGSAGAWSARFANLSSLDPSVSGVGIRLDSVDMSTISQASNPLLIGYNLSMPGSYTSTSTVAAALMSGDGRALELLSSDCAVCASSRTENGILTDYDGTETNTVKDALRIAHRTSADMANNFGAGMSFAIEDSAAAENLIGRMAFKRNGADNVGTFELFTGTDAGTKTFWIDGSASAIFMPEAQSDTSGLIIAGQATGGILFDDGVGFVIDGSRGDPIFIGDTVSLQMGDNAGVEKVQFLDSDDVAVWFVDSNGNSEMDGKLGIQTTPLTDIHIKHAGSPEIRIETTGGANDAQLSLIEAGGQQWVVKADNTNRFEVRDATGGTNPIQIEPGASNASLWLDATGKVGVFNSSPSTELDVTGAFQVSGASTFNGEITYGQKYIIALQVPLVGFGLGPSNNPDLKKMIDDGAGSTGVFQYAFDATTEEELFFSGEVDFGYDEGTNLTVHIHWAPDGTGGANQFAQWGLEYAWVNIDGTMSTSTIIYTDASSASTATTSGDTTMLNLKNYQSNFPAISGTGKERCSTIVGRFFRDATDADDDYPNDAWALVLDFDVILDQPGIPA
jgi:hypothetical protein